MKNLKNYLMVALILIAVGSIIAALHFKRKSESVVALPDQVKKQVQAEATIIARKVDKEGLQHVTIKETENIIPIDRKDRIAISQGVMDTTAKALARVGILEKQLQSLTIINSTLTAENLKAKQIIKDGRVAYGYKDKYVNLEYTPPSTTDTLDKGKFDFAYNADLNIVQYWKRNWFLGAKHSYIDIYSNDPRTTVNGVKRLKFEQKQPIFGLRIQAGANYNPQTGSAGFGPAARFDVGRFSIQGNYTYYPESERWRPSINANYDLVRF